MRTSNAGRALWTLATAIALALGLASWNTLSVLAQAGTRGQWRTSSILSPINPIHLALMNNGKVLVIAGSGNVAAETNFQAAVWDPLSETFQTQPLAWDMFCNGMVVRHDGLVFVNGGNLQYDPFHGEPRNAVYNPATGLFTDVQNMAHGRWYPTTTTLGDGRVMAFSGLRETGGTNTTVEIYTAGSGWSQEYPAGWTPPLYPRMHLSTDGRVFYSGSGRGSRFFNPATNAWTGVVATTNYGGTRTYGTSVLLPLTPANGYRPRVMILGGGNPGTPTTEIIDLSAPTPAWQYGPPMSQPRIQLNATLLPSGKVLAVGGSTNDEDAATASLNADIFDPVSNTFAPAAANVYPRLYHSGSLLLQDATVLLVGGNPQRGNYQGRFEIYSPAYLFNANGTPAIRPNITDVSPGTVAYGATFQVQTPDAADIASVVLVRPGTPTHAFDMEQRLVGLSYTVGNGVLAVTAPPNGNIAPPGYYMLFVLNAAGVPSVARFVRLVTSVPNQAPTASITTPATNVTVNPGGVVSFSGTGSDPDGGITAYGWTFPGGSPTSSALAAPGNVIYSTPGAYIASFTVTDDDGLPSQAATRTITVSDFSLTASPASRTVLPGTGTSYTATVASLNGFTGTVSFSATGLPAGVTAAFTPATVTASGSTTLNVSTTAATALGTYPLVIQGTSGTRTRTANVTLVVNSVIAPSGLMAAYAMDEGTGATINDWTSNGHTGTISGATRTPQGKFGGALSFDGVNDWVTVADSNALDFTTGMTAEAWVYPTANGGGSWRNIVIKERVGGEVYTLYANADTNAPVTYVVGVAQPGAPFDARGTSQLPLNTWTHVATTYDGTTLRIYVNGVQSGSRAVSGALLTSTGALRIGGNGVWGEFFQGRLDEIRLYNRALTQAEIQTDMTTAVGVDVTAPIRSNGQPGGALPAGTTQTTLSLTTNESATCRFGTVPGVAYSSKPNVFTTTGATGHATVVSGLMNGTSYSYYVRCQDGAGNANADDLVIAFSVANPPPPDTTPPVVSMTAPAEGAIVWGNVIVSANASDLGGVVGVQFLLDGEVLGQEDTTAPYSTTWNSTGVANGGPHQLSARARDAASHHATATVSVTVDNSSLGLVAAYSFDQGSGTTLADRTGTGHTGTITGATWTTQGKFGSALQFDGVNDWVTVNDADDLDFTSGMTVEAWVFPTASGGGSWRNVLMKERAGGEAYNLYANADTDAPVVYVVTAGQPGVPLDARGTTTAPVNTWTHLAATYDGTTLRLWVNGVQVGSRPVAGPLLTSSGMLRLGGNSVWGEYFQGRIDEVRIYNRALNAAEIQADMNARVQP